MAFQTIIVLDNPPADNDPWAAAVFRQAKCTVVSNEAIARAMAEDPKTAEALAKGDPAKKPEEFAAFYRKALEKLHGKDQRIGLYGTAWLQYVPRAVDACVVDWSALDKVSQHAKAPHTPEQVRTTSQNFVRGRVLKTVAKDRLLELKGGLSTEQKVAQTISFLAGFKLL